MNEGGQSEPTPLVHDGIIYLINTGNIVQALDGRTGELIWEHQRRSRRPPRRDAQHRDLSGQGVRGDRRRATGGARCAHRQTRVGRADRRAEQGLHQHQRSDRHQRQGAPGPGRMRPFPDRIAATSAPTTPKTGQAAVEVQHGRPARGARRRHLGRRRRTCSARVARPGLPAATTPISISPTGAWRRRSRGWRRAAT